MTINAALEEIKTSLPAIKTLIYADLNEMNLLADQLISSEYPMLLVMPVVITETTGISGIDEASVNFEAYMLDKNDAATTDYINQEVQDNFIEPMRLLARKFIHSLQTHSVVQPGKFIGDRTYTPEYGLLDAHLFGVNIRCQIPILEKITACI